MNEVTLDISARFNDQASPGFKSLLALSDRLNASLEAMRERLRTVSAEAQPLAHALERVNALSASNAHSSTAHAGASSASNASEPTALDASGAQTALNAFAASLESGSVRSGAALGAFEGALGKGASGAHAFSAGAQAAADAARASSGGFVQGAQAARSASAQLGALGAAAATLRARFAAFRLPSVAAHASGGILSTPHMGIVAEQGPEAIIPLSPQRRARGVELLRRAGRALGVREYADGGVPGVAARGYGTTINMGGISVNISAGGEPARELHESGEKLADDVARAIASGLERALRNMA